MFFHFITLDNLVEKAKAMINTHLRGSAPDSTVFENVVEPSPDFINSKSRIQLRTITLRRNFEENNMNLNFTRFIAKFAVFLKFKIIVVL